MFKLVEDVSVGEKIFFEGFVLEVVKKTPSNGEGFKFSTIKEDGSNLEFSKSCGTKLEIFA